MAAITLIVIAAFAIDRVVKGLFFLLSFSSDLRPLVAEPSADTDVRVSSAHRLIYGLVAGYLGIVVVAGILKVRLFAMTQIAAPGQPGPNALMDTLLTGLILAAGADRLADLTKNFGSAGGGPKKADGPIEITGKLTLEHGGATLAARSQTA